MNQIAPIEHFSTDLVEAADTLAAILPPHIDRRKFEQTALVAAKNNPSLLNADRQSLMQAVTEAAEDGLHPDGREGVITVYKDRSGKLVADWNPMLYGIRKRAREICDMIIEAQVVYANDKFVWHQGDSPRIEHTPAPLGTDRGKPVGVYAIFKQGGIVLHREVMAEFDINQVKSCSRAQGSLMWTKFWSEAWKKVVIRRGIKTVPSVMALERLVSRDDKHFDFAPKNITPVDEVPSAPAPKALTALSEGDAPSVGTAEMIADQGIADAPASKPLQGEVIPPKGTAPATSGLDAFKAAIKAAESIQALNGVWSMFDRRLTGADRDVAVDLFEGRFNDLGGG